MSHYTVTYADILEAHERALKFGGRTGIINTSYIQSAIGRPYSGYHETLAAKSAALLHAVVQNHGFTDGNKRTALLVTTLLIRRSGYRLELNADERIDDMVVAVAGGEMGFDDLELWFQDRLTNDK
ncbi:MAG: type II toxin-antitoxin system death-on-curing family toxin [Pseudomonadota bacterium]